MFLKRTPGEVPDWNHIARTGDEARYVRRGTGGVDGTKANRRLPRIEPVVPHFPRLDQADIEAIMESRLPLPSHLE